MRGACCSPSSPPRMIIVPGHWPSLTLITASSSQLGQNRLNGFSGVWGHCSLLFLLIRHEADAAEAGEEPEESTDSGSTGDNVRFCCWEPTMRKAVAVTVKEQDDSSRAYFNTSSNTWAVTPFRASVLGCSNSKSMASSHFTKSVPNRSSGIIPEIRPNLVESTLVFTDCTTNN